MFSSKEEARVLEKTLQERKPQGRIPVWFMRQAGRYLPEYHKVMGGVENFLQACYTPEIMEEVTLQPIRRFDVDAAIMFSDIMVVPDALGYGVDFKRGYGPKVTGSLSTNSMDGAVLRLSPIFEGIKRVRKSLPGDKTLIGFAGSPWTVATYVFGGEKNFFNMRKGELLDIETLPIRRVMEEITQLTSLYLVKQVESGVDVLQLFDSNVFVLPVRLFEEFVIGPTKEIISYVHSKYPYTPITGFPKGSGVMYKRYSEETGVSAVSVDYSVPIAWIKENLNCPIQGNLDPFLLAYSRDRSDESAREIVRELRDKPLVFNLGHGILPETPLENVESLIRTVREAT
ncbi:MAG: uroporphyrinogen decarboxylase [Anaplasma sp.]